MNETLRNLAENYHDRRKLILVMETEIKNGALSPEAIEMNKKAIAKLTSLNDLVEKECGGFVPQPSCEILKVG